VIRFQKAIHVITMGKLAVQAQDGNVNIQLIRILHLVNHILLVLQVLYAIIIVSLDVQAQDGSVIVKVLTQINNVMLPFVLPMVGIILHALVVVKIKLAVLAIHAILDCIVVLMENVINAVLMLIVLLKIT